MVRGAVAHTSRGEVAKVEHVWNSFLWGHYAQNAKVCCCRLSYGDGDGDVVGVIVPVAVVAVVEGVFLVFFKEHTFCPRACGRE